MSGGATSGAGLSRYSFPLFVPANRPERFAKAAGSGTDTIIIDLEDAVSASEKDKARTGLGTGLDGLAGVSIWVRINAVSTPWHEADLKALSDLPVHAVMLPKAESASQLQSVRDGLPENTGLIALVETARGIHAAHEIAAASDRMAFGSVDYALDMNIASTRDAFLMARSTLALAARIAGQPAPIDGVTTKTDDATLVADDAAHALELGFGGKLLIHPKQITPARSAFVPSPSQIEWAQRIVANVTDGTAVAVDGEMIDAPVLEKAKGILERQERLT